MNKSSIEWTTYTSNPIQAHADGKRGWFCERVSPGCAHCYSSTLNMMRGNGQSFLPANRENVTFRLNESELAEWSRKRRDGRPLYEGRCFAFDMTDLFGEWVPDEWLIKIFRAFEAAPNLQFQVLSKRAERMHDFVAYWMNDVDGGRDMPENVWLGVTVENQRWADHRIPILLDTPAAVRFVSAEPLLQKVELWKYMNPWGDWASEGHVTPGAWPCIDWVIVGGESGPGHRPFDPEWAQNLVDQGHDFGCAIFVKQLGGARPGNRLEDLPEDLQVRQFPR